MTTTATRYAAMLARPTVCVLTADGGLACYDRVIDRARRLMETGRDAEAEEILADVARTVRDAKAQNGR